MTCKDKERDVVLQDYSFCRRQNSVASRGNMNTAVDEVIVTQNRVDVRKAINQHLINGISQAEIARNQGVSRQAINQAVEPFKALIKDKEYIQAINDNMDNMLTAAKFEMLVDIVDVKKRKKATTGNAGYVFDKLNQAHRLERGESTQNIAMTSCLQSIHRQIKDTPSKNCQSDDKQTKQVDLENMETCK